MNPCWQDPDRSRCSPELQRGVLERNAEEQTSVLPGREQFPPSHKLRTPTCIINQSMSKWIESIWNENKDVYFTGINLSGRCKCAPSNSFGRGRKCRRCLWSDCSKIHCRSNSWCKMIDSTTRSVRRNCSAPRPGSLQITRRWSRFSISIHSISSYTR